MILQLHGLFLVICPNLVFSFCRQQCSEKWAKWPNVLLQRSRINDFTTVWTCLSHLSQLVFSFRRQQCREKWAKWRVVLNHDVHAPGGTAQLKLPDSFLLPKAAKNVVAYTQRTGSKHHDSCQLLCDGNSGFFYDLVFVEVSEYDGTVCFIIGSVCKLFRSC